MSLWFDLFPTLSYFCWIGQGRQLMLTLDLEFVTLWLKMNEYFSHTVDEYCTCTCRQALIINIPFFFYPVKPFPSKSQVIRKSVIVVLTCRSVDEVLVHNHSNESCWTSFTQCFCFQSFATWSLISYFQERSYELFGVRGLNKKNEIHNILCQVTFLVIW